MRLAERNRRLIRATWFLHLAVELLDEDFLQLRDVHSQRLLLR